MDPTYRLNIAFGGLGWGIEFFCGIKVEPKISRFGEGASILPRRNSCDIVLGVIYKCFNLVLLDRCVSFKRYLIEVIFLFCFIINN